VADRLSRVVVLLVGVLTWFAPSAQAQSVGDVFRKVNSSVVVIRARGRDVSAAPAGGLVRFNETGSGVIVSAAGQVITAAHVVNAMDEITVEAVGGEAVTARVVSAEPAADVALLQRSPSARNRPAWPNPAPSVSVTRSS
jgi:serine protease Do